MDDCTRKRVDETENARLLPHFPLVLGAERVLPSTHWVCMTSLERHREEPSEFLIGEHGTLYLAAILDLHSRFVVVWAISAVNDRQLTLKALEMAVQRRCPAPGLLHHSDRGCTYTGEDYQTYLASNRNRLSVLARLNFGGWDATERSARRARVDN